MASIEPYTQSRIDYLARYLQGLLPGLDYNVAKTWITSEKGVSGNVLGTTYTKDGKQRLYEYSSQEAGLEAAANWIKTRSIYAGVKNSLSGTSQQQATALAQSPWNRSYYTKVFSGLMGGQTSPSGGTSTPLTDAPNKSLTSLQQLLDKIGIDSGPFHKFTQSESDKIATELYHVDPKLFGSNLVGKTVSELSGGGIINFDPLNPDNPLGAKLGLPDITSAVIFIGVILVGITLIATGGIISLKGKT